MHQLIIFSRWAAERESIRERSDPGKQHREAMEIDQSLYNLPHPALWALFERAEPRTLMRLLKSDERLFAAAKTWPDKRFGMITCVAHKPRAREIAFQTARAEDLLRHAHVECFEYDSRARPPEAAARSVRCVKILRTDNPDNIAHVIRTMRPVRIEADNIWSPMSPELRDALSTANQISLGHVEDPDVLDFLLKNPFDEVCLTWRHRHDNDLATLFNVVQRIMERRNDTTQLMVNFRPPLDAGHLNPQIFGPAYPLTQNYDIWTWLDVRNGIVVKRISVCPNGLSIL
ncbi:unnamed protein product, partial [Mesorhabditis spiculigera]